jgi:hypothetical protein
MSDVDQCKRIAELESQLSDIRELLTGSEQESPVALCRELLDHDTALVSEVERLKAELNETNEKLQYKARLAEKCAKKYATIIGPATEAARAHGYALAVHGSLDRDLDMVAIPWTDNATSNPCDVAEAIREEVENANGGIAFINPREDDEYHRVGSPGLKPFGRAVWAFHLGGGPYLDLSIWTHGEAYLPEGMIIHSAYEQMEADNARLTAERDAALTDSAAMREACIEHGSRTDPTVVMRCSLCHRPYRTTDRPGGILVHGEDCPLSRPHPGAALLARLKRCEEALRAIAKGEGAFSRDPLTHATNTIENLKAIAADALAGKGGGV